MVGFAPRSLLGVRGGGVHFIVVVGVCRPFPPCRLVGFAWVSTVPRGPVLVPLFCGFTA